MPFTPAHPAIVLPFLKNKRLSATALIIGSTSPDFEYFFKASVNGVHGHTLAGIFYFDLPVTVFLSIVFHQLIKKSLYSNLPLYFQEKFGACYELNLKTHFTKHYRVVLLSALLGSASHVFWDSFTHNGAFFVERLAIYKTLSVPFDGVNYPLFYGLQHISTFIGLTIVVVYIIFMPSIKSSTIYKAKLIYWICLIMLSTSLFCLRFYIDPPLFDLGNGVVTAISSLLIGLCVMGFFPTLRGEKF